jgi:environmental stress-induced protein Ves
MTILRLSDYKRMPWKNGGGETLEIALSSPDRSTGTFDWRISMATVAADGPFSVFPGIDRTITIIDGDAIELSVEGQSPVWLDQAAEPYSFPGDVATSGRLRDGPIADLNVMVRRGLPHTVTRLAATALPQQRVTSPTLFLVALEDLAFRRGDASTVLRRHDTVDLSGTGLADIFVETSGTVLLIAIG